MFEANRFLNNSPHHLLPKETKLISRFWYLELGIYFDQQAGRPFVCGLRVYRVSIFIFRICLI